MNHIQENVIREKLIVAIGTHAEAWEPSILKSASCSNKEADT